MTEISQLQEQFTRIQTQGYSLDDQEFLAGVNCAAVPLRDACGQVCAAVTVSAPQARIPLSVAINNVPLLLEAAEEISAARAIGEANEGEGEDINAPV